MLSDLTTCSIEVHSPTTTKRGARMTRTPLVSRIVTGESPPGAPYIILFLRRFLST